MQTILALSVLFLNKDKGMEAVSIVMKTTMRESTSYLVVRKMKEDHKSLNGQVSSKEKLPVEVINSKVRRWKESKMG